MDVSAKCVFGILIVQARGALKPSTTDTNQWMLKLCLALHSAMNACTSYLIEILSVRSGEINFNTRHSLFWRDRIDLYAHDFIIGSVFIFLLLPFGSVVFLWFCSGVDLFL